MVAVHEVTRLFEQAHDQAAQTATQRLRAHAASHGWPSHLAGALRVVHEDGAMRIDYPPHLAQDIEDLEYGTQSASPSAVLRTFGNRLDQHADLGVHLDTYLGGIF